MIDFKIDRQRGKMLLIYPENSGIKNEEINLTSHRNAMGLWRMRIRTYVMNVMMAYCKNRTYALAKAMTPERQIAIIEIRYTMLANYEGKDLTYFLTQVMKLSKYVVVLAPHKNSNYLNHYQTVVLPMFHWIYAFLKRKAGVK